MTQKDLIRDYIEKHGSITPFEAFTELGCTKLATRISEMRADGEIIFSRAQMEEIYATGRGSFKVRAVWSYLKKERIIEVTQTVSIKSFGI